MQLTKLKPRKALNKAFLKVKPNRSDIESFKENLIKLLDRTNETESEEFHKNLVSDFLKQTYYRDQHFINTKGRNDLVIHNGKNAKSSVGVIIEAKKPTNKAEMVREDKINTKAFHELVLYYLRERITANNLEIKYLVATNQYEWFIFDANVFEKAFASNKKLVKQFEDFEAGRLAGKTTDFFYKEIAEPFVAQLEEVEFTHFDLHKYERPLRNNDKKDDSKLIALFKLLSPEHLLKLPFANDSNSLDKRFYAELLHIIGLTETKQGGKKLIEREKPTSRNNGSLLENTIRQLETFDKTRYVSNPSQYGESKEEKLFAIGLELCITWMNRVLFLKLLEAQLLSYHKGDSDFKFLDFKKIGNYDKLNLLFFQVLAQREEDRSEDVSKEFKNVPYLNSSLFDHTELEHQALFAAQLADDLSIPIYSGSVLKDGKGKRRTGEINTLQYLFEFLDAYDFSSEGSEEIQEDNKTLINASVLGLIFEKINGYKDGSFFTPGFITMYMCRETIRRAVLQKFNERKSWNCKTLDDLYDKIEDRNEANDIVNSIKICDPAVGSGHFLVSALNEIIAVKNDLKILQDRNGRRLKEYQVEVVNDELIITDEEGELFEYSPTSKESQRIQETLFHEKQTIIENCLFGVDINNNSVKICRLRLWIELLKSAYYKTENTPLAGAPASSSPGQGRWPKAGGVPSHAEQDHRGIHNHRYLKTFRKDLRNNATPAEAAMWNYLKGKKLEGRKFRRQHSVGNYILDFYCPSERIAIELDGEYHNQLDQKLKDEERDLFLENFGIMVLRFENKMVFENPENILRAVKDEFGKYGKGDGNSGLPTTPAPPFEGGEPYNRGNSKREPYPDSSRYASSFPPSQGGMSAGQGGSSRHASSSPPRKGGVSAGRGGRPSRQLETLPNIDINIKAGNSLISRFELDADLKKALIKSDYNIDSYRIAVETYRNARNKDEKRQMVELIKTIKGDFETNIESPFKKKIAKARGDVENALTEINAKKLWGHKIPKELKKKLERSTKRLAKLEDEKENIQNNVIYQNAFEWRFEFPEVLNENGDFIGFDVVIGNPPYAVVEKTRNSPLEPYKDILEYSKLSGRFSEVEGGKQNLYRLFIKLAREISKINNQFTFITPLTFIGDNSLLTTREFVFKKFDNIKCICFPQKDNARLRVFEDAKQSTLLLFGESIETGKTAEKIEVITFPFNSFEDESKKFRASYDEIKKFDPAKISIPLVSQIEWELLQKIHSHEYLRDIDEIKVRRGEINQTIFREFITSDSSKERLIKGVEIGQYRVNQKLSQGKKEYFDFEQYAAAGKSNSLAQERRIATQRITGVDERLRIVATIIDPKAFFADSTNSVHLTKDSVYTLEYILGLLNSKLYNWRFKKTSSNNNVSTTELESLPFTFNEKLSNSIQLLVEKIFTTNQSEVKDQLKSEIDRLVYELYGLTEEEIGFVEDNNR